ncbi:MAG: 30S ribosomal protein S3 [Candidatus Diapherotrites archaeon CG08_land_8_20_14_0_20_34_12]|nr:MAG: 30S ribosomal protein S3 [Candidatus Diapherotrites archaeon CG08_land_8_20_14_0_20_34_12]
MIEKFFIQEGIKKISLENYLKKELNKAGFCGMAINKTPLVTRIIVSVTRPGLAIGKGGTTIAQLTHNIGEKFKIENPQIEINEIKVPELNAKATLNKIIALIERGFAWKSVAFRTTEDTLRKGAMGIELVLKGKLTGKGGRKMKHRIAKGYMKKAGHLTELVDYAKGTAYTKAGAIGIRLRIIRPGTIFPDKISIQEILDKSKAKAEAAKNVIEVKPALAAVEEVTQALPAAEEKIEVEKPEEKKVEEIKVEPIEHTEEKKIGETKVEHTEKNEKKVQVERKKFARHERNEPKKIENKEKVKEEPKEEKAEHKKENVEKKEERVEGK